MKKVFLTQVKEMEVDGHLRRILKASPSIPHYARSTSALKRLLEMRDMLPFLAHIKHIECQVFSDGGMTMTAMMEAPYGEA